MGCALRICQIHGWAVGKDRLPYFYSLSLSRCQSLSPLFGLLITNSPLKFSSAFRSVAFRSLFSYEWQRVSVGYALVRGGLPTFAFRANCLQKRTCRQISSWHEWGAKRTTITCTRAYVCKYLHYVIETRERLEAFSSRPISLSLSPTQLPSIWVLLLWPVF